MSRHPYRSQFPSVGPKMVEKLEMLGISSCEQLKAIGAESAMIAYMKMHGGRQPGMCSCLAYAFEGIIENCNWYDISDERKEELKKYVHELRKKF